MAYVNARQWQRLSYRADVQLGWDEPSPESFSESASCVDLSLGGIQVRARNVPDVGAAVSCKLVCSGRWLTLPGRVRWCRREIGTARDSQLGIEFGPLNEEESQRVRELVTSAERGGQRVQLRVGALRESLEALALPTDQGVRLRVLLPWFATGSELDFELRDPPSKFAGRVVHTEWRKEEQDKHWQLELLVEPRETPRSRRYTMYGAASELASQPTAASAPGSFAERASEPAIARARDALREPAVHAAPAVIIREVPAPTAAQADRALPELELAVPKQRGPRVLSRLAIAALVAAALLALTKHFAPALMSSSRDQLDVVTHAAPDAKPLPAAGADHASPGPTVQTAVATVTAPRAHDDVAAAEPDHTAIAEPQAPASPTAPEAHDQVSTTAGEHTAIAEPQPAAPSESSEHAATNSPNGATNTPDSSAHTGTQPAPSELSDPDIRVSEDETQVFVPTRGSLDGMRVALWVDPLAVAVDVPGQVLLTHSRYAMRIGAVSGINVGRNHHMTQVRVLLSEQPAQYSAEAVPDGLLIHVKHDLRPMP